MACSENSNVPETQEPRFSRNKRNGVIKRSQIIFFFFANYFGVIWSDLCRLVFLFLFGGVALYFSVKKEKQIKVRNI